MRIHLHDFSGHPFQVQLARQLASRGHEIVHTFASQYVTGRGQLQTTASDPEGLRIRGISARRPMAKYSPRHRLAWERSFAKAWCEQLDRESPDVVIACNAPLFALPVVQRNLARRGIPMILWHQDLYSLAIGHEAARRLPKPAAGPLLRMLEKVERRIVAKSAAVVAIGEQFVTQYALWGLHVDHVRVVPNWAPLDEITPGRRENEWSVKQGLDPEALRLMYTGTLGRKHNPMLLIELTDAISSRGIEVELTVVNEGEAADMLREAAATRANIRVLPYQPYDQLPNMLASADVLIALLEPEASRFSVPSKVLSYLSAGRPVLALMPPENPSAGLVTGSGGFVAEPTTAGIARSATWAETLALDPRKVAEVGASARRTAEVNFDIERIADEFESLISETVTSTQGSRTEASGISGIGRT